MSGRGKQHITKQKTRVVHCACVRCVKTTAECCCVHSLFSSWSYPTSVIAGTLWSGTQIQGRTSCRSEKQDFYYRLRLRYSARRKDSSFSFPCCYSAGFVLFGSGSCRSYWSRVCTRRLLLSEKKKKTGRVRQHGDACASYPQIIVNHKWNALLFSNRSVEVSCCLEQILSLSSKRKILSLGQDMLHLYVIPLLS